MYVHRSLSIDVYVYDIVRSTHVPHLRSAGVRVVYAVI